MRTADTVSPNKTAAIAEGSSTDEAVQLSPREIQVVELICAGLQPAAIADKLSLSVKTVSTYRARLFQKLPVKNNAQIGIWAERNGLAKSVNLGA